MKKLLFSIIYFVVLVRIAPSINAQVNCSAFFYWYGAAANSTEIGFSDFSEPYPFSESEDSIINRVWNFGDGTTSTIVDEYFTHIYPQAGEYLVSLNISTANGCTSQYSDIVKIYTPEDCAPAFYNMPYSNLTVQYEAYSINGNIDATWTWNFGDGNTETGLSSIHTYAEAGAYEVSLTMSGASGCTETVSQTVIVEDIPNNCYAYFTYGVYDLYNKPREVTFFNNSYTSNPFAIPSYNWDFGDGTSSDEVNPSHTYPNYGTYTSTLTINADNCVQTFSQTFLLDTALYIPNCQPGFTYSASQLNPYQINFSNYSVTEDSILSWEWDFGDGSVGTGPNPSHIYAPNNLGVPFGNIYDVTMKITTAACGVKTIIQNISFLTTWQDTCDVYIGSQTIYDQTINLYGQALYDATESTWFWDLGDGTTYNGPNVVHVYEEGGDYNIMLTVISQEGCTYTVDYPVFIFDSTKCYANFYYTTNQGAIVNFQPYAYIPSGAATYQWDFGDGSTSSEFQAFHEYAGEGEYTVTFTVSNGTCSYTYTSTVYIDPWLALKCLASAGNYPSNNSNPLDISFFSYAFSTDPVYTTSWNVGDGTNYTNLQEFTHTYPAEGVYNVSYSVNSTTCADTTEFSIYVGEYYYSDNIYCQPNFYYWQDGSQDLKTVQFYASNTFDFGWWVDFNTNPTGTTQFSWDFGDGTINEEIYPLHTFPDTGYYFVKLMVSNGDCIAADSSWVFVGEIGYNFLTCFTNFTYLQSPNDPMTFTFYNQSAGETQNNTWSFGDGEVSYDENPTHTFSLPGFYVVSLNNTNSDGCNDNNFVLLQIAPNIAYPQNCQASFQAIMNGTTVSLLEMSLIPQGDSIVSWAWDFGDGNTSNLKNPIHNYQTIGNYPITLTITTQLGCSSTFLSTAMLMANTMSPGANLFVIATSNNDQLNIDKDNISIVPNPFIDDINIYFDKTIETSQVTITLSTIDGKQLETLRFESLKEQKSISLPWGAKLPPGAYLLQIQTKDNIVVKQLVK